MAETPTGGEHLPSIQRELFPVREAEVDGVQMGVLNDGTPYLTMRGLARLCGIASSSMFNLTANWALERTRPRGIAIQELLAVQGHASDNLFIRLTANGVEVHAYPDSVCMAILEYYAFESSQVDNDVAVMNYRLLARTSFRAYIYNRCGYDPDKHIPDSWRNFHERVLLNDIIPVNYFSVFREIADLAVHLIQSGCQFDDHTVPDGSVGIAWAKHWEKGDYQQRFGERLKHPHIYPDWYPQSAANPVPAWIYPIGALGDFRVWLYETYIKDKFPRYVQGKVKDGVFLPSRAQMLLAALGQKKYLADGGDGPAADAP